MDKFTEALEGIKTTASKAMDLCQSLQTQNKAQAARIAELEKANLTLYSALFTLAEKCRNVPMPADSFDELPVFESFTIARENLKGKA